MIPMLKSRFGKALAVVAALIIVICVYVFVVVLHKPASPFEASSGESGAAAQELVQRGAYFARVSDCIACHSIPNKAPFSGGLAMQTPMGTIFATNITPDKQTGIGAYSLADFDRAVRRGVAKDGHRLYPAMPYPSYAKLKDEDVRALYAYFMNGVRPANVPNRPTTIPWPLNMRWPLALWNVAFAPSNTYEIKDAASADRDMWNRGAYLVQSAGHCGACHTPRGVAMNEKGVDEGSTTFLAGAVIDGWFAPSLRGDANTGLGRWSDSDVYRFLKTGRNAHSVAFGSMTEVINNSTQFMTDDDLKAIAVYLKSLPGNPPKDGAPWHRTEQSRSLPVDGQRLSVTGAQTYYARCSSCHGADGAGKGDLIPPLAGSASALARDSSSQVNVTLNGAGRLVIGGVPDAYHMPAYRNQLSDKEVADVLNFVRQSWGNTGSPVKNEEVAALRAKTNPSNGTVVLLPAN
jgi:alcohol dehydrogenase (quinone), cytochrome c subunit